MYRDDLDAARARIAALEGDLKRVRAQLADADPRPCTSREHARQMTQLDTLSNQLELARKRARAQAAETLAVPPEHAALERQIADDQRELRDLELLARGDGAILEEIETCARDIERLTGGNPEIAAEVAPIPEQVALVHAPPRELQRAMTGSRIMRIASVAPLWAWFTLGGTGYLALAAGCWAATAWLRMVSRAETP